MKRVTVFLTFDYIIGSNINMYQLNVDCSAFTVIVLQITLQKEWIIIIIKNICQQQNPRDSNIAAIEILNRTIKNIQGKLSYIIGLTDINSQLSGFNPPSNITLPGPRILPYLPYLVLRRYKFCNNPLRTALLIYSCLMNYILFYSSMSQKKWEGPKARNWIWILSKWKE